MKRRRPYLQLFPGDLRGDQALRLCGRAARSFWIDLFGLMHFSEPRGYLLINGRAMTASEVAKVLGDREDEVVAYLDELERNGVFSRTDLTHPLGAGVIFCRRMVREAAKDERDRANGSSGGNPELIEMRELAESNLKGAMRDFEKKDRAKERARRYRERKKQEAKTETTVTRVTPSVTPKTSRVTSRVTVDKRDAPKISEAIPIACASVTGVNPHLPSSNSNLANLQRSELCPSGAPPATLTGGDAPTAPDPEGVEPRPVETPIPIDDARRRLARARLIAASPDEFPPAEVEAARARLAGCA